MTALWSKEKLLFSCKSKSFSDFERVSMQLKMTACFEQLVIVRNYAGNFCWKISCKVPEINPIVHGRLFAESRDHYSESRVEQNSSE